MTYDASEQRTKEFLIVSILELLAESSKGFQVDGYFPVCLGNNSSC